MIPTRSIYFTLDLSISLLRESPCMSIVQITLYDLEQFFNNFSQAWFGKFNTNIMHQIQYFMRRLSTMRLTDIMQQIQYLMRRQAHWDWPSILWSLQISHQALIGPRVYYICNKLGTWIVCTRLRGSVRIWIGLYNPIRIGIGL